MVLPSEFYRLLMKWSLPNGDQAQCSTTWKPNSVDNTFIADAGRLESRALDYWTSIKDRFAPEIIYSGTTTYLMDSAGHVVSGIDSGATSVPGTAGSWSWPMEVAVVVSVQTSGRGRSDRGRFYLPPVAGNQGNDQGLINDTCVADLLAASATFLGAFSAPPMNSYLWSRKNASLDLLETVRVGNVPDAQRRRRNASGEVYSSALIP